MRSVTRETSLAFREGRTKKIKSTVTHHQHLWLHDNLIAVKEGNFLYLSCAGWNTPTTRERLNGLMNTLSIPYWFSTCRGQLYFSSAAIADDEIIKIELCSPFIYTFVSDWPKNLQRVA